MEGVPEDRMNRLAKYYTLQDKLAARRKLEKKAHDEKIIKHGDHVHEEPSYMPKLIKYVSLRKSNFFGEEKKKHTHVGLEPEKAK